MTNRLHPRRFPKVRDPDDAYADARQRLERLLLRIDVDRDGQQTVEQRIQGKNDRVRDETPDEEHREQPVFLPEAAPDADRGRHQATFHEKERPVDAKELSIHGFDALRGPPAKEVASST
jgi:hypothetical protein